MSNEKHEGGCCSTDGSKGSCCGTKKLIGAIVLGLLIFIAGMLFAKSCPLAGGGAKFCPMSGAVQK